MTAEPTLLQDVPPFVEYWKVTVPVGVPDEPVTVAVRVSCVPTVIGLDGVKDGAATVALAFTVNAWLELVEGL